MSKLNLNFINKFFLIINKLFIKLSVADEALIVGEDYTFSFSLFLFLLFKVIVQITSINNKEPHLYQHPYYT